jgi:hypothetical protein
MKKMLKRLKKWWHKHDKEAKKMSADKQYAILRIVCR